MAAALTHVRRFGAKSSSFFRLASTSIQKLTENVDQLTIQALKAEMGRLFAVVHISGVQRKVTAHDMIAVHSPVTADIGERIVLNKVLLVGGKNFTLVGRPVLAPDVARVEATVIEKTLTNPQICFWYHRRQNHKRFFLRREQLTVLRINTIEVGKVPEGASRPIELAPETD